jgi:hypothetical protein
MFTKLTKIFTKIISMEATFVSLPVGYGYNENFKGEKHLAF